MSDFEEIPEQAFEWRSAEPGLKPGVENRIDAVLALRAPLVLRDMGREPMAPAEDPWQVPTNGLHDIRIFIDTPDYVTLEPISDLIADGRGWCLPDITWQDELTVAVRLVVVAGRARTIGSLLRLARVKLTATAVLDDGADTSTIMLGLRMGAGVLSADEWLAIPPDESVVQEIARLRGCKVRPTRAASSTQP